MNDWKEYYLTKFLDFNPKVETLNTKEYSFVEMPDLESGRKYVFPSRKRKPNGLTKFQNGDTLFAKITPCLENGKICQVQGLEDNTGVGSTEFFVFRGKENVSDNDFVHYLLKWYPVKKYAEKNMSGSAGHQRVPVECLHKLKLLLPLYNENQKIGALLSGLDAKIDNLHQQNQTLEKIAQTLFKQWFVDFNFPNENERPYKDNGGEMVDSELGEIPGGWRVKKLGDCLKDLIDNRGKTPEFVESGIPALSAKFVKNGNLINRDKFNFVPHDLFNQSEKLLTGDIIMTSEAPLGELYYVSENTQYYPAQRVFAMRADQQVVLPSYLYFWLDSFVGQYLVKRRGSGSTVQGIKQSELKECEVIIPDWRLIELADSSLKVILIKKEKNETQIQVLAKTRDTLLPKLMSGKIRVDE